LLGKKLKKATISEKITEELKENWRGKKAKI